MVTKSSSFLGDGNFFPPGFRFHPTDEELVLYYLKRKICRRRLKLEIVCEIDVYKWDPEELPGQSELKTGDRQWFFFSPRDRKYPNGARSNRATMHGYWKATGKDRTISCNSRSVGLKKTLVFYEGRAPCGARTDWVMHEYTLDEEELKRCQSAHDYYVLYKLFKKSGPGPKNGEQYGAPFIEEKWDDEDCLDFNGFVEQENPVQELNHLAHVDNTRTIGQQEPPLNDLDELFNMTAEEPALVPPLANFAFDPPAVEEETQSTLLNYSSREPNFPDQNILVHQSYEQYDVQPSFDLTHSTTSQLQLCEVPEVTSASNITVQEPQPQVDEKDFLQDFLEIDDLIGSEPTLHNFDKPVENLQFDGLSELDVYQDADPAMFLSEIGPDEWGQISPPYMNNFENGMVNPASHLCLSDIENEAVNYQLQSYPNDANQISCDLWTHDQSCSVYSPAEATQGAITPTSGVVCDGNSAKLTINGAPQNQGSEEDDGTGSWFSSALWSFVDAIPSTPASASESSAMVNRAFERMSSFSSGESSAMVSRAFERMSSFSRGRISTQSSSDSPGNLAATSRKLVSSSRGIIYFSVLGVVCAILWVFIWTSVEVLGSYIAS